MCLCCVDPSPSLESHMSESRRSVFWMAAASVPIAGIALYALRRSSAPRATVDLSSTPGDWSVGDVGVWLQRGGSSKNVVDAFARAGIDGRALSLLQESHMSQMGIALMADRIKAMQAINELYGRAASPSRASASSDGDDVVLHEDPESNAPAAAGDEAHHRVMAMAAAKLKEMYEFFGSNDFVHSPREVQHKAIAIGTQQTQEILKQLNELPDSEQRVALINATDRLVEVINGTSAILQEADEKNRANAAEQAPAQPEGNINDAAGAPPIMKVAEVLEQFQSVLTSDEMLKVDVEKRRMMVSGIEQQLRKIRASVLPALPPRHHDSVRDSIDSLLELCARLTSEQAPSAGPRSQNASQATSPQRAANVSSQATSPQRSAQGAAATETQAPTPASLQFIVSRLRNVFETVRSPTVIQEANPAKRLELLATARREADALAQEGQLLPADQREVVAQVVDNVVAVIQKLADASRSELQRENEGAISQEAAAAAGTPQSGYAVAEALSKQLAAILNVLKSQDFEGAASDEQAIVARKMLGDVERIGRMLAQQPAEVKSELEPARAKIERYLNLLLAKAGESEQPANDSPSRRAQAARGPITSPPAEAENVAVKAQQMSQQLIAIINVIKSDDFDKASLSTKKSVCARLISDLEKIGRDMATMPDEVREQLQPTCAKVEQLARGIMQAVDRAAPGQDAEASDARGPSGNVEELQRGAEIARRISQQLSAMINVVKSEEFEQASTATRLALAQRMVSDLDQMGEILAQTPEQVRRELEPTRARIQMFLKSLVEQVGSEDAQAQPETKPEPSRDADAPAAGGQQSIAAAQALSQQLVGMLNVIKSGDFEEADPSVKVQVAQRMRRDLAEMDRQISQQPADVQELLRPTHGKLAQFLDMLLDKLGGDSKERTAPIGQRPTRQQQQAAEAQSQDDDEEEEAEDGEDPDVSAEFRNVNAQLGEIVNIVRGAEFNSQGTAGKLDVVSQLQELLSNLVQRANTLSPQEKRVAMHNAGEVNKFLKAVSDPLLREAEDATDDSNGPAKDEAANNRAMQVVQKVQRLFAAINSDAFLDAAADQRAAMAGQFQQQLVALIDETRTLDEEQQASILPLLRSLTSVLGKLGEALGDDEEAEEGDEDDDDASGEDDEERSTIFEAAKQTTDAINRGDRVKSEEDIARLSELLDAVDRCGVRSEAEIAIRNNFQAALQKALSQLENTINGDDDGMDGEPSEAAQGLIDFIERVEEVDNTRDLAQLLPQLSQLTEHTEWRTDPALTRLVSRAISTIRRRQQELAASGVEEIDDEGAEEDAADNGDGGVADALTQFKQAFTTIIEKLATCGKDELPMLMSLITRITDAEDSWKSDQEAVVLVNRAIAGVQAASRRVSEDAQNADDGAGGEGGVSRIEQLLRRAAAEVRAGRGGMQFVDLATRVAQSRDQLSKQELAAYEDLESALQEASQRSPPTPATPAGATRVPPNTPAVVVPKSGDDDVPPLVADDDDDGDEPVRHAESEGDDDDNADADESEAMIMSVLEQVRGRISALEVREFKDLAPFAQIIGRLRQGKLTAKTAAAIDEVETLLAEKLEAVKDEVESLRNEASSRKEQNMKQMIDVLRHPSFPKLPADVRADTLKKCTALLTTLTPAEQQSMLDTANTLIEAIEIATAADGDDEDSISESQAFEDLSLLPRILERLNTTTFLEDCSAFEVQCIARILSRLSDTPSIMSHEEFSIAVRGASQRFARAMSSFTGSHKEACDVATPLMFTGMTSEGADHLPVVQYTVFSPEEADEGYTPDEVVVSRFAKLPDAADPVTEETLAAWRSESVALMFNIDEGPDDVEVVPNSTARSEMNDLAQVLEEAHGFEIIRRTSPPTVNSIIDAIKSLSGRDVGRLLIYIQSPTLKSEQPLPQHAVLFKGQKPLNHYGVVKLALKQSAQVLLVHDSGNQLSIMAGSAADGASAHIGVKVTEAAHQVGNTSRCWVYDGLMTPIVTEALCIGDRTLCPEDLANSVVRTLVAKDGADGAYLRKESPATAVPFFAPGVVADE